MGNSPRLKQRKGYEIQMPNLRDQDRNKVMGIWEMKRNLVLVKVLVLADAKDFLYSCFIGTTKCCITLQVQWKT